MFEEVLFLETGTYIEWSIDNVPANGCGFITTLIWRSGGHVMLSRVLLRRRITPVLPTVRKARTTKWSPNESKEQFFTDLTSLLLFGAARYPTQNTYRALKQHFNVIPALFRSAAPDPGVHTMFKMPHILTPVQQGTSWLLTSLWGPQHLWRWQRALNTSG